MINKKYYILIFDKVRVRVPFKIYWICLGKWKYIGTEWKLIK